MSKVFLRFSWITLVFIFLVVIAGSVVRSTGSGMGCPDWPKCFDQYVPPTDISELPENYKDIYANKRREKVDKFARVLSVIGLEDVGEKLKNDESLFVEQNFNWKQTWTEYGNRLVGFIAGNLVLISFIWVLIRFRSNRQLVFLSFSNLILIGFEAWLGSIVVATNLVPWVLTLHMLFALIIIAIQIKIIQIAQNQKYSIRFPKFFKSLFYLAIVLTVVQILLGVQVRQKIDFLVVDNIDRGEWLGNMGADFYFHRSFSWLVLIVNVVLLWLNNTRNVGIPIVKYVVGLILIEFITGVLFSYANMPAFIQPIHLLIANLLLAIQLFGLKYLRFHRESLIR